MYKKIYCYDALSGEYTNEDIAQKSPLDKEDVYLFPPNCTEIAPPKSGEHQKACFVDETWELAPDYRGEIYYSTADQSKHEITELGVEPDAYWTDIAPTDSEAVWTDGAWTIPLSVNKERKRHVIWAAGDAELAAIKANYTQAEIESWSKQEQGAKDINAGSTATDAAQFVASIATARGIALETLVTKILANVSSYGALSAAVIGQQQRLDTLITASTTQAELDAIVWTSISGGTA